MVHIQTFGHIPSLLFYLGRYFFSALGFPAFIFIPNNLPSKCNSGISSPEGYTTLYFRENKGR